MKKILCLLLLVGTLISLISCKDNEYPPVESTDEELRTVMTMEIDGQKYEIKYELYRALFLSYASEFDGGSREFWNSDTSADAKAQINELIKGYAADIYASLHLAKKLGFDPYSSEVDATINGYIKESVEGNVDKAIEGFGGNYDAYLAWLSEMGLNYSTQVLLYRYAIAYDYIVKYYTGTIDEDNVTPDMVEGALEFTRDDVHDFYLSGDCVRVSIIEINSAYISRSKAQQRRDTIASYASPEDALNYAISLTAGTPKDILDGVLIGTLSLDDAYYRGVTEAAFDLEVNETSQLIDVFTDTTEEYWILFRQDKTDDFFEKCYEDIENVYLSQKINEKISAIREALISSTVGSQLLENINYAEISMP